LRSHSVLFSVDIGLNRIGEAGAAMLFDAVRENRLLLEVNCDGCDAAHEMGESLTAALVPNIERFQTCGGGGGVRPLLHLKRARAEAVTALSVLTPTTPCEGGAAASAAGAAAGTPPAWRDAEGPRPASPDGVFCDADEALDAELNARCEAGWRYSAVDREILHDLRGRVRDLKALRRHEREHGDEVLERVVAVQRGFRERLIPTEERIIRLKEALAGDVEATKGALQRNIQQKIALKAAEQELEEVQRESCINQLGAQKLESSLKLKNREVAEEVDCVQREVHFIEENIERLKADNEKCRRLLHAARFETETERFAPPRMEPTIVSQPAQ